MNILIGLLLALGCAVTTNVASVLKHRGANRAPARPAAVGARLAVSWLCLLAGGYVIGTIFTNAGWGWDQQVVDALHGPASGGLDGPMRAITALGGPLVLDAVFAVSLAALLFTGRRREAVFLALASPGTVLLVQATKALVHRTRPTGAHLALADGSSWPSGHASGSAALYGALLLIALRHSGQAGRTRVLVAAAGVAVLLIGLSRVYLGVHYVSDVAAAWAITATWLAFLYHWQLAPRPEPLLTRPASPAPLPFATAGERR